MTEKKINENDYISSILEVKKAAGYGVMPCLRALKRMDGNVQKAIKYLCENCEDTIQIGMIREICNDDAYPSIRDLINRPIAEKKKVLEYMKTSKADTVTHTALKDAINPNKSMPDLYMITDGTYTWSSAALYYFEKYDMELPEEFVQWALEHL